MHNRRILGVACVLTMILAAHPAGAEACAIDNVASLTANGVPAMRTSTAPAGSGPWAPFVLAQALAPGTSVRLDEAEADLARTLPAAVRSLPFRWQFGDGTMAIGRHAVHRYARPGQYHLFVYGYYQRERRWFAFDSALVRVVPAGQLLQANLEYLALRVVIALSGITWPLDAMLLCVVLLVWLWRSRERPAPHHDCAGHDGNGR